MKKFLVLLLSFCFAVILISCVAKDKEPDSGLESNSTQATSDNVSDTLEAKQTQETDPSADSDTETNETDGGTVNIGSDSDDTSNTQAPEDTNNIESNNNGKETLVSEKYYKILKDTKYFYYTVYGADGKEVLSDKTSRPLTVKMSDEEIVDISIGYGTGIASHLYYSVSRNSFSDELFYVVASSGELAAYLDGTLEDRSLVITNVFDEQDTHITHKLSFSHTDTPVTKAEFSADGTALNITYLSGKGYTEKSHKIYLKAQHALITVRDCYVRTDTVISPDTILRVGSGQRAVVQRAASADTLTLLEYEPITGGSYTSELGIERNNWYKVLYNNNIAYVTADSFVRYSYGCECEQAIRMYNAAMKDQIHVDDRSNNTYAYVSELTTTESIKFTVLDMDGDGTPEAVLDCGDKMIVLHYYYKTVYAYVFNSVNMYGLRTDGTFNWTEHCTSGDVSHGCAKLSFSGSTLHWEDIYEIFNNSEYYINAAQVTEEELIKYINENPVAEGARWHELTYVNIDTYLPAECDQSYRIPADFSNYGSILKTYKSIVELCEYYTNDGEFNGVYDRLFYFPSEAEQEWFDSVFDSVFQYCPKWSADYANAFGYALKDLNGDGTEELILMLDEYYIIAIFTVKDGKPVLLDTYIPRGQAVIRNNGDIYVYANGGAITSLTMIFRINAEGEMELINAAGYEPDNDGLHELYYKLDPLDFSITYITENEYIEIIDDAEWNSLGGYNSNEYMRNVTAIEFISLFEPTQPNKAHIDVFSSNYLYSDRLAIFSIENGEIKFKLLFTDPDTIASADMLTAYVKDDSYVFSTDKISGRIEFGTISVWVIIESSEDDGIARGAYLFNRHVPAVG